MYDLSATFLESLPWEASTCSKQLLYVDVCGSDKETAHVHLPMVYKGLSKLRPIKRGR